LDGPKLTIYQNYPQIGHDTLKKLEFPWPISDIILQHRECFDGSGFSQGIKGESILIEARIIAVANAIEDFTSNNINRPAMAMEEALAVIRNHSGSKYDPKVADACLKLFKEKGYTMR
jgi:HD-GYP domain-containing protein (c-di-GMP phosphodiesterase class II)